MNLKIIKTELVIWPYRVESEDSQHRTPEGYRQYTKIVDWLHENRIKYQYSYYSGTAIWHLKTEDQAMLFVLRWS